MKMDSEQFSAAAFDRISSPIFRAALSKKLREAVEAELAPLVANAMHKIVEDLNRNGHSLVLYGAQTDTEIHYRDEANDRDSRLLLACDIVVTTVYQPLKESGDDQEPPPTV